MDAINIIFLVHDIHFVGGGERVTVNMANYFAEKGYQVGITSLSEYKSMNTFRLDDKVEVYYLNIPSKKGFNLLHKTESLFRLRSHFRNYKKESIVLGIGNYPSLLLALLPKRENLKTVGCQHLAFSAIPGIWRIMAKAFFNRLDCLVTLTAKDAEKMKHLNKKVLTIPNAVPFYPESSADLKNKNILAIGRLDPVKGFDILIRVFKKLADQISDWCLTIIGEGIQHDELVAEIRRLNLAERVKILPWTDKVLELYLKSSVYVMTSRAEGFPMVLLEAQACGLPVIAFNCETGPSEIINDGNDGYLIDNFDIDEMTGKLSELCLNDLKRIEFGQKARKNVEKFLPDEIFNKWEELFDELQKAEKFN